MLYKSVNALTDLERFKLYIDMLFIQVFSLVNREPE